MVNLTTPQTGDEALEVVWSAYIGGPTSASVVNDVNAMKTAIDQAFVQSPYLSRTQTK